MAWAFWHKWFLVLWMFWHGIFWHLNILAHGYFGTLQSNNDVSALTFWHLCYCAKMSMYQNVPNSPCRIVDFFDIHFNLKLGTISQLWLKTHGNASLPKNPCADKSLYQSLSIQMSMETKCPCAGTPTGFETCMCWNLASVWLPDTTIVWQQLCDDHCTLLVLIDFCPV